MAISWSVIASLAASVGILPLMELNVPYKYQLLSRVLMRFIQTTVEPTPTFTSTVRLEDIVRVLAKELFALDWWSVTEMADGRVATHTPDGIASAVS